MLELVPQHLIPSHWNKWAKVMTKERTDWKAIGRELGRVPVDCYTRFKDIRKFQMKKGHFTAEEDALICQRVKEWGDKGKGLWVALEKEMDRAGVNIRGRWLIQRDLNNMHWTDEMVYSAYVVAITTVVMLLLLQLVYFIAGCAPHRGGGAAQGTGLGEGGGVHGGWAEFKAVQ